MTARARISTSIWLAGLLCLAATSASAQLTTFWHNASELLPQDSNITIVPGVLANSVDVQMGIIDSRFIVLPLTLPSDRILRSVTICYQTTNPNTFITQLSVTRMTTPDTNPSRLNDSTDLTSTTPTCYTTTVVTTPPNFKPDGAMTLLIRITAGSTTEKVTIGGIGITVE